MKQTCTIRKVERVSRRNARIVKNATRPTDRQDHRPTRAARHSRWVVAGRSFAATCPSAPPASRPIDLLLTRIEPLKLKLNFVMYFATFLLIVFH